jgi:hypothetical protein
MQSPAPKMPVNTISDRSVGVALAQSSEISGTNNKRKIAVAMTAYDCSCIVSGIGISIDAYSVSTGGR